MIPLKKKLATGVLLAVLVFWSSPVVDSFCDKAPYGHLCRNLDLTAFCIQFSQMIKIRDNEAPIKPYIQMDKIFEKLHTDVRADQPFVHFGGYKQPTIYPCIEKRCTSSSSGTGGTGTGGTGTGGTGTGGTGTGNNEPTSNEVRRRNARQVNPGGGGGNPGPGGGGGDPGTGGGGGDPGTGGGGGSGGGNDPVACPPPSPCEFIPGPPKDQPLAPDHVGCALDCECCKEPPKDDVAVGSIWSLQDGCELKYLKAPIEKGGTVINPIAVDSEAKMNPYKLEVTEISVKNFRLHNWLHITISSEKEGDPFAGAAKELGKGNIKMAFIIAHDAMGFPVGEFVNTLPCGSKCNCEEQNKPDEKVCHQGTFEDHIPCMFDGERTIANTGMMMVVAEDDSMDKGLKEIHASWRYAQSQSPENFITELHFRALIVDDYEEMKMLVLDSENSRLSGMSERPMIKQGLFGWNPVYTILHPTRFTVGGWDYYREGMYSKEDLHCHRPISKDHYILEPYPDSGPKIRKVNSDPAIARDHCYRLNSTKKKPPLENVDYCFPSETGKVHERYPVRCPGVRPRVEPWFIDTYGFMTQDRVDFKQVYPWTLVGGRTESYTLRDGAVDRSNWNLLNADPAVKLYWGLEPEGDDNNQLDYKECEGAPRRKYGAAQNPQYPDSSQGYDIQGKYGHFCNPDAAGRRVLNLKSIPVNKWPNTLAELNKLPRTTAESYFDDRCYCPKLPATPDPRFKEPPEVQVQGRKQHAYQMFVSWNCILPFGIFVSRYYKETYSKVFFIQEYWWYTMHVLCMVSNAMFTFGGIYVMELKRVEPINWLDPNITAHVVVGYLVMILNLIQVGTGFFRIRDIQKRIFNIFMHWLMGITEYLLAVACMFNSAFILLSGMTCAGVVALVFILVIQVLFYASMEVHMRNVDKILKLKPPRSYLPPPVMRVFHKDAPGSKFRIYVLVSYFFLCVASAVIQYLSMTNNELGESCFLKSNKYVPEEDFFYGP